MLNSGREPPRRYSGIGRGRRRNTGRRLDAWLTSRGGIARDPCMDVPASGPYASRGNLTRKPTLWVSPGRAKLARLRFLRLPKSRPALFGCLGNPLPPRGAHSPRGRRGFLCRNRLLRLVKRLPPFPLRLGDALPPRCTHGPLPCRPRPIRAARRNACPASVELMSQLRNLAVDLCPPLLIPD